MNCRVQIFYRNNLSQTKFLLCHIVRTDISLDLNRQINLEDVKTFTCIQYALGQNSAKLGHDIIMFIIDDFGIQLSELIHLKEQEKEL